MRMLAPRNCLQDRPSLCRISALMMTRARVRRTTTTTTTTQWSFNDEIFPLLSMNSSSVIISSFSSSVIIPASYSFEQSLLLSQHFIISTPSPSPLSFSTTSIHLSTTSPPSFPHFVNVIEYLYIIYLSIYPLHLSRVLFHYLSSNFYLLCSCAFGVTPPDINVRMLRDV